MLAIGWLGCAGDGSPLPFGGVDLPPAAVAGQDTGADAGPIAAPDPRSGCEVDAEHVRCPQRTVALPVRGRTRDVHVGVPPGDAPPGGWPVAVLFQGSFFPAGWFFHGREGDPYGGLHQARTVEALLSAGFAVVAPEAHLDGATFWDTNVPPYSVAWRTSGDHQLMLALFAALDAGDLGPLSGEGLVAAGISSGGYMSSRVALEYPDRFRAIAVHSASYATCSGAVCFVPALPDDHAPTLFLHGERDVVVPIRTARAYERELDDQGTPTAFVADPDAGHEWLPAAPDAIVDWFTR